MDDTESIFRFDRHGKTVIAIPVANLREFDFERIQAGAETVLSWLENGDVQNLVIDFSETEFYGSTALEFFVKLWKRVCSVGGKMAFCGVSEHELEVLQTTKLDSLWPICKTREEALAAVEQ